MAESQSDAELVEQMKRMIEEGEQTTGRLKRIREKIQSKEPPPRLSWWRRFLRAFHG